jgi:hypothetical protein
MPTNGARGLVKLAQNQCELLAAMVSDRVDELRFYERIAGRQFRGEYGERVSSMTRGQQFEAYQLRDDAAELRRALQPILGSPVEDISVLGMGADRPGLDISDRDALYQNTRDIFARLSSGDAVPTLLLQPQLRLTVGEDTVRFIAPDFLVLIPTDDNPGNPGKPMYVPGEIKSMITRDGVAGVGNLGRTRQQCAVELLALRDSTRDLDLGKLITNRSVIVCGTPYGFRARAALETIDAAVYAVEAAVRLLKEISVRLGELRKQDPKPLADLTGAFRTTYTDKCRTVCILADYCREQYQATARILGDSVSALIGPDTDIERLYSLLSGGEVVDATQDELDLAQQLTPAMRALGITPGSGEPALKRPM